MILKMDNIFRHIYRRIRIFNLQAIFVHVQHKQKLIKIFQIWFYLLLLIPAFKIQSQTLAYSEARMTDQLSLYYQNLYPYHLLTQWLTYNGQVPLFKRQISFEFENGIVQRYIKFTNANQWKKYITCGNNAIPRKLDAGAIFQNPPQKNNKDNKPVQRELIFDFDMNDYDDVRNCCQGKKICSKCWKLLLIAMDIISLILQQDFGFEKFMYVFSGGRGVHIWVCDKSAREMKDSSRKALVDYLELATGSIRSGKLLAENVLPNITKIYKISGVNYENRQQAKKQYKNTKVSPHVLRALQMIQDKFMEIFVQQDALIHQKGRQIIGKILTSRSSELKDRVFDRWSKCQNDTRRFFDEMMLEVMLFERSENNQEYIKHRGRVAGQQYQRFTLIQEEIMLSFLYPRMDYNVSTMKNHLLKLPFSVHPTTKNISVPMFKQTLRRFVPQKAIKIGDIIQELKCLKKQNGSELIGKQNEEIANYTNLNQYLRAMRHFCQQLKSENKMVEES